MRAKSGAAFFEHFDRHAHGKGLKGASTHYCPGCGHGLVHKYLAECIAELGIQDRTVAISALGHKLANPDSIVVSYQGDGDLASIGLAEILHAAQLGLPISVLFVNNAIYGMTGGQMAPTTLPGQWTTTTPAGRAAIHGKPLKVAEMIAGLDGPVYVERTALFDHKVRLRTKKAIRRILELQMEGRGFGLVEVLSECPVHLKLTPVEAEAWVREKMTAVFPLGVLKNEVPEPWYRPATPRFDAEETLARIGARSEPAPRFCEKFPEHLDPDDVSLKLAGAGGDGAQTAALLIAKAAINEGLDATHIPSYGPESRGGTSYADVHVAREEVLSPASAEPHVLLAFNAPSLEKFGPQVVEGGIVLYDSSVVTACPPLAKGVRVHAVPFTEIARDLGKTIVKNIVALGALQEATRLLSERSFLTVIRTSLAEKCAMIPMNEAAFEWGVRSIREGSPE
jgi:2-oxoisovalerate ferredoxin oxidoreductase beta subunit